MVKVRMTTNHTYTIHTLPLSTRSAMYKTSVPRVLQQEPADLFYFEGYSGFSFWFMLQNQYLSHNALLK